MHWKSIIAGRTVGNDRSSRMKDRLARKAPPKIPRLPVPCNLGAVSKRLVDIALAWQTAHMQEVVQEAVTIVSAGYHVRIRPILSAGFDLA